MLGSLCTIPGAGRYTLPVGKTGSSTRKAAHEENMDRSCPPSPLALSCYSGWGALRGEAGRAILGRPGKADPAPAQSSSEQDGAARLP